MRLPAKRTPFFVFIKTIIENNIKNIFFPQTNK
jgi:hypothetical protein